MVTFSNITHSSQHAALLVQDRSGNTNCLNCIIETHQTKAYNLARSMLDYWSLAEDAVQESLVSAYRAFPNFRGANIPAWLMRIVANTCRDMLCSRRAKPTVPLDPTPVDQEEHSSTLSALDLPSTMESPEDQAERGAPNRAIQDCLNSLPQERRFAEVLLEVQAMSYEEASVAMNCNLGTVKSRVSGGHRGLRDCLQHAGGLLPSRFRHT